MSPPANFGGTLSKIAGVAAGNLAAGRYREVQQHGLLEPLIDLPAAVGGFGHAGLAAVEQADGLADGRAQFPRRAVGREFGAPFVRGFDDVAQVVHVRYFRERIVPLTVRRGRNYRITALFPRTLTPL